MLPLDSPLPQIMYMLLLYIMYHWRQILIVKCTLLIEFNPFIMVQCVGLIFLRQKNHFLKILNWKSIINYRMQMIKWMNPLIWFNCVKLVAWIRVCSKILVFLWQPFTRNNILKYLCNKLKCPKNIQRNNWAQMWQK